MAAETEAMDHPEDEEVPDQGVLRDYLMMGPEGVDLEYVTGLLPFTTAAGGAQTCELIGITEVEGRCLVAVPAAVWHKRPPKRLLPRTALTKVSAVEVAASGTSERAAPLAATNLRVWIGFLDPSLELKVDFLATGADYPFGVDGHGLPLYPHGQALQAVVNDTFVFQSAESAPGAPEPAQQVSDRLTTLEDAMSKIAAGFKVMMERQAPTAPTPAAEPPLLQAKPKARQAAPRDGGAAPFPNLDPGVARAAQDAGVSLAALAEMDRLVGGAPRVPGFPKKRAAKPAPGGLGLSESEEDGEQDLPEPPQVPAAAAEDPLGAVLSRLTQVVETLAKDKRPAGGQSKLDVLLDGAGSGGAQPEVGGATRRNSAARRALRQALTENPKLISRVIANNMAEDLLGMAQPGVPPLTSARAWVEHRSRIGAYNTLARTAWSVAGALDSIRQGRYEETEARLSILLLMLDQVGVDRGSWTLASELSLEPGVPMHSFRLHDSHRDHEQVHSRLLDSRWAELALGHLREQMEFAEKREKLGRTKAQGSATDPDPDEGEGAATRPRPKPKAQPKK